MKNKSKLGLSLLTGLTTLSVATPLATSCAKTNKYINHVHESEEDKLYGINANTYENVKKDYINQLQNDLFQRGFIEGSEEWNQEMNNLNYSLNIFDNYSKTMNMSYGDLTTGLMTYAKRNNGLSLQRTTDAKPSDVDDMYQGARNSFDLYMDQLGFSSSLKAQVFASADDKFAALKTQLQEKGTMENDPYGALQEARTSLLKCFDSINADISRKAALITISQFKKLYSINLKSNFNFTNFKTKLDEAKGKPISDDLMNQMFDCIDNENGSTTTFRTNIMTGYVLTPILNDVRYNAESNTNEIDVVWSCISSTYVNSNDTKIIEKATAYQYDLPEHEKLEPIMKSDKYTENDLFKILKPKVDTSNGYFAYEEEKTNLKNTYFNDANVNKISFKMPDASDPHAKCDPFYYGADAIREINGTGKLSTSALADTGIMISFDGDKYEYLSDVIKTTLDKKFDEKNATLSQKFVKNCEIYANIEETDRSKHAVTINLVTRYKNSCLLENDLTKWMPVNTLYSVNAPISKETFKEFSKNYSIALDYLNLYMQNDAKSEYTHECEMATLSALELAISSSTLGVVIYSNVHGLFGIDYNAYKMKQFVGYIVICSLGIAASSAAFGIYTYFADESRKFSNKIEDFKKEEIVDKTLKALETGKDIFVKMQSPKFVEFDQTEFDKKYEAAKMMDPIKLGEYNDLFVDAVKEDGLFNKKARQYGVSKTEFLQFIDSHEQLKDLRLAGVIALGISSMISLMCFTILGLIGLDDRPFVSVEEKTTIINKCQEHQRAMGQWDFDVRCTKAFNYALETFVLLTSPFAGAFTLTLENAIIESVLVNKLTVSQANILDRAIADLNGVADIYQIEIIYV